MTEAPLDPSTRWTFLVPGLARPAGGLFAVYELANALAEGGADRVQVAHLPTREATLQSAADISWFRFHDDIEHHFLDALEPDLLPDADVIVYTVMAIALGTAPGAGIGGQRLVERLQTEHRSAGRPVLFVQALGVFPEATELQALRGAGPKVCVAGWIADNLVRAGLPSTEVVHIPNGVDHRTFRVIEPVAGRPPLVAMNHNPHPIKNMGAGMEALERLARDLSVPSMVFGSTPPAHPLADGIRFLDGPGQATLAETVYNRASLYLQPSTIEGFGLCALEAMASGCALVTTANGGSADYAIDGETAVLCGSDADAMVDALTDLVRDDVRRLRIATNGVAHAREFRWPASAARLREVVIDYRSAPDRYQAGRHVAIAASVRDLVPPSAS